MKQKIAVPAVTLQKHAEAMQDSIDDYRNRGLTATARANERTVKEVFGIDMPDNPGQFVSFDATDATSLAADGRDNESEEYHDGLVSILKFHNIW